MQVDGANDELDETNDENDFDADVSDDSSNLSFPGTKCPICDEPTKMHKTYHLATRHFKQRLIETLTTVVTESGKVFRCPECSQDFKSRINLWTHYLGKHRFGEKWTAELLGQVSTIKQEVDDSSSSQTSFLQTLPTPISTSPLIKTEPKTSNDVAEGDDEKMKTPKKSRSSLESGTLSSTGKRVDFWCDLCQSAVLNSARIPHFANVHFDSRLRRTLPTSGVFSCPLCRHEGKNFLNLSTHFLGKHTDYMKNWFREELDKLEEAAFAKAEHPEASVNGNKHDLSSGEEVDTSVRLLRFNFICRTTVNS
jgi:hypothetical protein